MVYKRNSARAIGPVSSKQTVHQLFHFQEIEATHRQTVQATLLSIWVDRGTILNQIAVVLFLLSVLMIMLAVVQAYFLKFT